MNEPETKVFFDAWDGMDSALYGNDLDVTEIKNAMRTNESLS